MNKKSPKKILIRTEASPEIGMGHLVRCLSLSKMLKQDFEVSFLLNRHVPKIDEIISSEGIKCNYLNGEENKADHFYEISDAVVLDGYGFGSEIQEQIKQKGKILVFIDDLNEQHFYADAVINVSDSITEKEYSAEPNTKFFLGSQFALLRSEFIETAKKPARKISSVKKICISMGGADVNNITLKVLNGIKHISSIVEVHVIIGAVNPHEKQLQDQAGNLRLYKGIDAKKMVSILSECELMICPASGTSMEAAAVGIGMILGTTAGNQAGILNGLLKKKCAIGAGDLNSASAESISALIEKCIKEPEIVNAMISEQKKLIDGLSPQRINEAFKQLINAN